MWWIRSIQRSLNQCNRNRYCPLISLKYVKWEYGWTRALVNKQTSTSLTLLTGALCSCTALRSSSSTLLRQLWQIHSGTSPSSDCDSEGTASASLRPGASLSRACESAGTVSASLEPWPGSPLARPEPQSLNSRWHSKQHVCTDCRTGSSLVRLITHTTQKITNSNKHPNDR